MVGCFFLNEPPFPFPIPISRSTLLVPIPATCLLINFFYLSIFATRFTQMITSKLIRAWNAEINWPPVCRSQQNLFLSTELEKNSLFNYHLGNESELMESNESC